MAGSYSLSRLGNELSVVINRIRHAFGPVSMQELARRPQIRQAEQAVNVEAWRYQRGQSNQIQWQQALDDYENAWMRLLDEVRGKGEGRYAA